MGHAAAAVHKLIQASPRAPTEAEIAAAIKEGLEAPMSKEEVGDSDIEFGPVPGPDGKPLEFNVADTDFAADFCPWIRLAFVTAGSDRPAVEKMVRGLATEGQDAEVIFHMLEAWERTEGVFQDIGGVAKIAWWRVMAVAETLINEGEDIGRGLNSGAGPYLGAFGERQRASGRET
jgi:hypothetical protein